MFIVKKAHSIYKMYGILLTHHCDCRKTSYTEDTCKLQTICLWPTAILQGGNVQKHLDCKKKYHTLKRTAKICWCLLHNFLVKMQFYVINKMTGPSPAVRKCVISKKNLAKWQSSVSFCCHFQQISLANFQKMYLADIKNNWQSLNRNKTIP